MLYVVSFYVISGVLNDMDHKYRHSHVSCSYTPGPKPKKVFATIYLSLFFSVACFFKGTFANLPAWMSQEVFKWLVNVVFHLLLHGVYWG